MATLTIIDCSLAAAFAALALAAMRGRAGQAIAGIPIGAALTASWAVALALPDIAPTEWQIDAWFQPAASGLDVLRLTAWLIVLLALTKPTKSERLPVAVRGVALGAAIVVAGTMAVIDIARDLQPSDANRGLFSYVGMNAHLAFGLLGLVIVENVWRNTPEDILWSVKFLLIAIGSLCVFDLYCYADALMFNRIDADLVAARPLVALMTAPLIGLSIGRSPFPPSNLAMSRQFVFHSAALLGGGLYLLIMGGAGLYIRSFGGTWGPVVQIAFLVGAGALLVSILASGAFRAQVKLLIAQHIFADKYDYRHEWLRFIANLAQEDGGSHLQVRVIKAIAQIVESPGGNLWLWDDGSQSYTPVERWNDRPVDDSEPATGSLAAFLARTQQVVNFDEHATRPDIYPGLRSPGWLRTVRAPWLVVPLVHRDRLLGFALLQRSRAPRHLDQEDYDLLKMIGRQAAAFLAEHQANRALDDAREMELFNRRFAFVVHDVKTMMSQLSLLVANVDKHGRNPEFQADLIASVRDSVNSMSRLLGQINAERRKVSQESGFDLVALVRRVVQQRADSQLEIVLDCPMPTLVIAADEGRMAAIVGHLFQNAMEAAKQAVRVRLQETAGKSRAVIEVEDDGPGMDPDFVRDQLFRPFASTKHSGFGIGAYQCRELTRELGGWMTVASVPGKGTTMRITFPTIVHASAGSQSMVAQ